MDREVDPPCLLETLAWDGHELRHLDRHLDRMAASAAAFGLLWDRCAAVGAILTAVQGAVPSRVRLVRALDGTFEVTIATLPPTMAAPVLLAVDRQSVDPNSLWVRHKTTRREVYAAAKARHPEADDVVLRNHRGELTETTVASLAVRVDHQWWTPPLTSGCLPGVGRAIGLESGRLRERTLLPADLAEATIAVVSSLRGWRPALLAITSGPTTA